MRKPAAALSAVALAALLALSACGTSDDDKAKANIEKKLLDSDNAMAGASLSKDEAGCVSDGMVDDLGVEKLQDYGLLNDKLEMEGTQPQDVSAEDARALAGVFGDCLDLEAIFEDQFASEEMLSQLDEKQRTCITDAVDEESIEKVLEQSFQGEGADGGQSMQEDLMACMGGKTSGGADGEMEMPEE